MSNYNEILCKEKDAMLSYVNNRNIFVRLAYDAGSLFHDIKKSSDRSNFLRLQGNQLYTTKLGTSDEVHSEIWKKYTLSIIFAPHNTVEQAFAYGNRSALFYYLNLYEDCIKDCDRAVSMTKDLDTKVRLLNRKAKCFAKLEESRKDDIDNESKDYIEELLNFERSQELPFASKSVAVRHNEKWGRHIVATEDIEPGAIIAAEKLCLIYPFLRFKHIFCGHCMKYLFMRYSIPCEKCVFNVYCSGLCHQQAWEKYHKFECDIYEFINYPERLRDNLMFSLRFILLAIHEAGGIEPMKKQLLDIENTDDPRIKGFSDGILRDGKTKSIFSLQYRLKNNVEEIEKCFNMEKALLSAKLLVKYTDFFGDKMDLSNSEMFLKEDILFIAALFLRFYSIYDVNMCEITTKKLKNKELVGVYPITFGKLFNHSCDANVKSILTGDRRQIFFTKYPIKKGSQLFLAYDVHNFRCIDDTTFENYSQFSCDFLCTDKKSRQKYLQSSCDFTCDCIACTKNWSSLCMPSRKDISKVTSLTIPQPKLLDPKFSSKLKLEELKILRQDMKDLSKNSTVYCDEYVSLVTSLTEIYTKAFPQFVE